MATNDSIEPKKRNYHIGWVVLFLIAIVLFATNPSEPQFKQYIKDDIKAKASADGVIIGAMTELLAVPTVSLSTIVRTDYYLFSVYEISVLGVKHNYIGILNHFLGDSVY